MSPPRLANALSPDYLGDLGERSIDDLRNIRADCQHVEGQISYLRRLIQGRLDIVAAELQTRLEGDEVSDLAALVAQLPAIFAERTAAANRSPSAKPLPDVDPDPAYADELDAIIGPRVLASLPDLPDDGLTGVTRDLAALEERVSEQRQTLHGHIDDVQAEIGRRYRDGTASVTDTSTSA